MTASRGTLLVTGAAGFVGARFVESCNKLNIPVISVDDPKYFKERTEHLGIDFGRIVDREKLFSEFFRGNEAAAAGVIGIVHLGACTDTTEFDKEYLNKMNLKYSQDLWTAASRLEIPLVYASSAATYGDGSLGYDDDESLSAQLKPLNPYGQSKLDFDLWALEQEKKGVKPPHWAGFKFFNVYGFGEKHKEKMASVVLHSFHQIRNHGRVKLFKSHKAGIKDGEQKRDFVFVKDVVHVLHFALAKPLLRGVFNLGSGQARTFLDLTRAVFKELNVPENIEFIDTPLEIRDKYQYFTEAKMSRLKAAGYNVPFSTLEEGIAQYVSRLLNNCS